MRLRLAAIMLIGAASAFAQGAGGTITGTITDKSGAVVPNASIEFTNQDTQAKSDLGTSSTGNYTLPNVPVGTYEFSVTAMGFKKFVRPGIIVQVGETVRVDAQLEVGANTESVTITAEAPLLKTESGEVSHQVDYAAADDLPLFTTNGGGGATGVGNIRDPLTVLNLLPGAEQSTNNVLVINGLPQPLRRSWSKAWTPPTVCGGSRTSRPSRASTPFRKFRFRPVTSPRSMAVRAAVI